MMERQENRLYGFSHPNHMKTLCTLATPHVQLLSFYEGRSSSMIKQSAMPTQIYVPQMMDLALVKKKSNPDHSKISLFKLKPLGICKSWLSVKHVHTANQ
ncbi:hypothetical protein SAY87_004896 [Trapa incisa]|uniref:Uncharacterized protein n=1 Tax=Trapa incisa TaxID=236973 RepID=A0AAN7PNG7_9MYRT|nr:hypothetical protein SAY87_004896 [Trapa incisa]